MSVLTTSKINQLLQSGHKGGLFFSKWLNEQGYSPQLISRYRSSGWLSALARGIVYRAGEELFAFGALSSYSWGNTFGLQRIPPSNSGALTISRRAKIFD